MKLNAAWADKLRSFFLKYRWPALVLLCGAALMLLAPSGKTEPAQPVPTEAAAEPDFCAETERRLARILSRIEGAGQVEVMLTLRTGAVTRYQTDTESRSAAAQDRNESERSEKTVLFSSGSAYNEPAVTQTEYPKFLGALIVAPGADDPAVRYELVNAVAALLGLGADQVRVVKGG